MEGSLTPSPPAPSIHASEYDPVWCMVALMRGLAESALKRRDSERKTRRGRLGECCAAMRKGGGGGRQAKGRGGDGLRKAHPDIPTHAFLSLGRLDRPSPIPTLSSAGASHLSHR